MKCPKCHYLSFDPEPRCKNCGFDLEVIDHELELRHDVPASAAPELTLREHGGSSTATLTLELAPEPRPVARAARSAGRKTVPDPLTDVEPLHDFELPDESEPVHQLRDDDEFAPTSAAEAPIDWAAVPAPSPVASAPPAVVARAAAVPEMAPTEPPTESLAPIVGPPRTVASVAYSASTVLPAVAPTLTDRSTTRVPASAAAAAPTAATSVAEAPAAAVPVAPAAPVLAARAGRAPDTTSDLPLFVRGLSGRDEFPDEGALDLPDRGAAGGRAPLGVRRSIAERARPRSRQPERRPGPLDHDLLEDLARVEREEAALARAVDARAIAEAIHEMAARDRARPVDRLAAAAVDALVLGGIATFVCWATLRLCNVDLFGLGAALIPLLAFLMLMDLGYLLMFTAAGGQTFGKMLMGIRVVTDDEGARLSLRQAAWRAGLTVISVVGLGLAWWPALFGRGEAIHDRIAHTRVVRA